MYRPVASTSNDGGVGAGDGQHVRAEAVVGDDDVRDFEPDGGAGVLRERVDLVGERQAGRAADLARVDGA